ncbi:hypothetical protein A4X13_0g9671 [Tilletia indica]|uniref:Reverse transcriptase RNase H-like domain-containing protein n=1 Tax=Tilletia indica TaxID=43049 RepID=A0A8T8S890_9BASI|nr:hypothetical protein A4X13_0g9671 [Tilletia indica]
MVVPPFSPPSPGTTAPPIPSSSGIVRRDVPDEDTVAASDSLPPFRSRRLPGALRDFQLGTVAPDAEADDVWAVMQGPIVRPRRLRVGDQEMVYTERPVAFLSRLTGVAERKLVAPELELICLAWAFHKLAHLLEGASVTVVTDHAPMERMLNSTSGVTYGPTITRCRALLLPQLDNLRFVYRPGSRHTNVDALSRLPIDPGRSSS